MTYLIKSQPKNVKFGRVYLASATDVYSLTNGGSVQIRIDSIQKETGTLATINNNSIVTGNKRYIIFTKPYHYDAVLSGSQLQTIFYWKLNGNTIQDQVKTLNEGYAAGSNPSSIPPVYEEQGTVPVGFLEIEANENDLLTLHADSEFLNNSITLKWNSFGIFFMEIDK
jgi:hypothetical protein